MFTHRSAVEAVHPDRVACGAAALTCALAICAIGANAETPTAPLTYQSFAISGAALTMPKPTPTPTPGRGQLAQAASAVGAVSPFPIGIRIGAMISPAFKFAGGVDVSLPQLGKSGFVPRFDADAIVSANFGRINTLGDVTLGMVYSHGLVAGSRIYFGAGVGPYFSDETRVGGKLILGGDLTNRFGLEANLHFPGVGVPLLTVQARFHL